MKNALFLGLLFLSLLQLSACANTMEEPTYSLGEIAQNQLFAQHQTFSKGYQQFSITEVETQQLAKWPDDLIIEVFFGTWCHDSEREVPRLLKVLASKPQIQVKLIALDYQKSDPKSLAQAKQIKFTPTFIVYKNNQEIGRIIERPKDSLVSDISVFLSNS